jgi:hypothetical protein
VGKGFPTHGPCQEGWERDFPPTDRVKKGGKGISHPRIVSRDFPPTDRVALGVEVGQDAPPTVFSA